MRVFLLALVLAVSGCATTTVWTSNGERAQLAKCKYNRTNCLSIIGKYCKDFGYTIIEEDQTELAKGGGAIAGGYGGSNFEVRQNYGIIFRCNSDAAH